MREGLGPAKFTGSLGTGLPTVGHHVFATPAHRPGGGSGIKEPLSSTKALAPPLSPPQPRPTPEDYCTPRARLPPTVLPLMLRLPGGRDELWGLGFLKSGWSVRQ